MRFSVPPPAPVLDRILPETGGEDILFSLPSDLNMDREFGRIYLAVTATRLVVADADRILATVPLAGLTEVRNDELYGAGRLLAVSGGAEIPILYYTNACVPEFASLGRIINGMLNGERGVPQDDGPSHCRSCAMPLPERGGNCPWCIPQWRILTRLVALLKPFSAAAAVLVATSFLTVGIQLAAPYITKMIVDEVIKEGRSDRLAFWIGALAGSTVLLLGVRTLNRMLTCWLGGRLVTGLRTRIHETLQGMSLGYFNRRDSGEMMGRVMNDTTELQHFLVDGLPYMLVNLISFFAIAGILLGIDWQLALLVFLPIPFLIGGGPGSAPACCRFSRSRAAAWRPCTPP